MKKFNLTILAAIAAFLCNIGCYYSEADAYIQDHTEYDWYDDTPDGFVIDFLMEESDDVGKSAISSKNLLLVNSVVYESTGRQHDELKSVTVWVAASLDSWDSFNRISPDGSETYANTMAVFYDNSTLDDFVLAINPELWLHMSKEDIVRFYVHELTHFIASREVGDSDHSHARSEYWGADGLEERLVAAALKALTS